MGGIARVAVKIRLMRVGKKKQPTYRVVVADGRSPRDGRNIETIGQYRPREEPSFVQVDADKALAWLRKGAQPTESVQKILAVAGVWDTFVKERPGAALTPKSKPKKAAEPKPEAAPAPAGEDKAEAEEAPAAEATDATEEAPAEDSAE